MLNINNNYGTLCSWLLALHDFSHLIFRTTVCCGYNYYSYFIGVKIEIQEG